MNLKYIDTCTNINKLDKFYKCLSSYKHVPFELIHLVDACDKTTPTVYCDICYQTNKCICRYVGEKSSPASHEKNLLLDAYHYLNTRYKLTDISIYTWMVTWRLSID